MKNPAVKVTVLGDDKDKEEVQRTAQRICDHLMDMGYEGFITEVALLGQLLGQRGAEFKTIK